MCGSFINNIHLNCVFLSRRHCEPSFVFFYRYELAAKECKLFLKSALTKEGEERKVDSRSSSPDINTHSGEELNRKVILTKFVEPDRLLIHFISNEVGWITVKIRHCVQDGFLQLELHQ